MTSKTPVVTPSLFSRTFGPLAALCVFGICGMLLAAQASHLFSDHDFAERFDRLEFQTAAPRDFTTVIAGMTHFDVEVAAMAPITGLRNPLSGVACARSKSGAYAFWDVLSRDHLATTLVPKTRFSDGDFSLISSSCWFLLRKL